MSNSILFETHRFGGEHHGPSLLISAGVHGDEYLPMLAVRELIRHFESNPDLGASLAGTLTLIPVVNRPAFEEGHRCGRDGLDLARTCPGKEDGTDTEKIAFALSREIEAADFYVDLHTGGTELCVYPLAGYVLHPDKAILNQQRDLARAFQLPFLWGTSGKLEGRSLSVARDAGVPAIYIEYLGARHELSESARGEIGLEHPLVEGCLNVMRHLTLLPDDERYDTTQITIEDTRPDSGHMQICHPAPETGFYRPIAAPGQEVHEGDVLAEIFPTTTGEPIEVLANRDGTVVVIRDYPRINQGDAVAVVAEPFGEA